MTNKTVLINTSPATIWEITQHYAVLVNWAQTVASYKEYYFSLSDEERQTEGIAADSVAFKCCVLRDDRAQLLAIYLQAGMPFTDTLDLLAAKGLGVVTQADQIGKNGKPIDPPKNWTWAKVAQMRALRAALLLSHGNPTATELRTIANRLYQKSTNGRLQALEAQVQKIRLESAQLTPQQRRERLAGNVALMRGPKDSGIE